MKASIALLEDFFRGCDRKGWGYSESEIAAAETRLSVSFPKVLKQYYSRFGTCPYIRQEGNNIPVPFALEDFFIPDSDYNAPYYTPKELDFLVFSGFTSVSAIDYGIRLSDLALEDPPVYFCDYGNTSWILENASLQNFLVTAAFWQIAEESRLDYSLDIDEFCFDSEELPDFNIYIAGLGMKGCELENLSDTAHYYRIFIKDGVILAGETGEWDTAEEPSSEGFVWLTVASNDKEKIRALKRIPGLLWEEDKDI